MCQLPEKPDCAAYEVNMQLAEIRLLSFDCYGTLIDWELGITEADVLERIYQGLTIADVGVSVREAGWVVTRLAELLSWQTDWAAGSA